MYKTISKTLTKRLKKVIGGIISQPQTAFITGPQILDGVMVANECIDERLRLRQNGILCKVDIEKAYDHIN